MCADSVRSQNQCKGALRSRFKDIDANDDKKENVLGTSASRPRRLFSKAGMDVMYSCDLVGSLTVRAGVRME